MTTYPNARRGDIWYVSDDALGGKNEDDRNKVVIAICQYLNV